MKKRKDTRYLILVTVLMAIMLTILVFNYLYDDIYGEQYIDSPEHRTVELTVVHWIDIPEAVIKGFEKEYPQIKVKFYRYHKDIYQEAIEGRIRDGAPIDVIGIREEDFYKFYVDGRIKDLSNKAFLKSYKNEVRNSIRSKSDAGEYAVALSSTYYGIWYNQSLFKKYNITVPRTYDEFKRVCMLLKSYDERTIIAAGMDERLLIPLHLAGNDKTTLLQETEMGDTSKNPEDDMKIESYDGSMSYQQAFEEFKMGRYAMLASTNESIQMCGLDMENVFVPGVFPVPFRDGNGREVTPVILADNMTGIFADTKKEEESYLFLNYISRVDVAKIIAQENSWITTIENATDLAEPYFSEWKKLDSSGVCDVSEMWKDHDKFVVFLKKVYRDLNE